MKTWAQIFGASLTLRLRKCVVKNQMEPLWLASTLFTHPGPVLVDPPSPCQPGCPPSHSPHEADSSERSPQSSSRSHVQEMGIQRPLAQENWLGGQVHQLSWSTECLTLHPELLQGNLKVNNYSSTGFSLHRKNEPSPRAWRPDFPGAAREAP